MAGILEVRANAGVRVKGAFDDAPYIPFSDGNRYYIWPQFMAMTVEPIGQSGNGSSRALVLRTDWDLVKIQDRRPGNIIKRMGADFGKIARTTIEALEGGRTVYNIDLEVGEIFRFQGTPLDSHLVKACVIDDDRLGRWFIDLYRKSGRGRTPASNSIELFNAALARANE